MMLSLLLLASLPAAAQLPHTQLPAKPCPVTLFLTHDGTLYEGVPAPIGRRRLRSLAAELDIGCYPEGGPSPVSSVTVNLAPHVPQTRVDQLLHTLAAHSWTRDRITILPWTSTP